MFDWCWDFVWKDRFIHFFLCNNRLFEGCSGHELRKDKKDKRR